MVRYACVRVCMSVLCVGVYECICKVVPQHNALTGTVAPTTFDLVPTSHDLHPLPKFCHTERASHSL